MRNGPHRLVAGKVSWAYCDGLSISVVALPKVTDDLWRAYLKETHAVGGGAGFRPSVSIIHIMYDSLTATQRGITADFLAETGLEPIDRTVVLTDDRFARGAMKALSWFLPSWTFRAFAPHDWRKGLTWLQEQTRFDLGDAERLLGSCYDTVGAALPRPR